jgi:hypothetical protein
MMQIAPMKHPRAALDAVTLNGRIYVVGGTGLNGVTRNDGESYDPGAMMWSDPSENLASGRSACTVEAMGDSLYCAGGCDGSSILKTVQRYDHRQGKWDKVTTPWMNTN